MGPFKYFKVAFLNRWNLLALGGGTAFGLISGRPDIVWPFVFACEIAYVALLGTHPKFQAFVEAQEHKQDRQSTARPAQDTLRHILGALPNIALSRFEKLRERCGQLRQIAVDLANSSNSGAKNPLESLQLAGLDKLLWIFLRLLFTQYTLTRFLEQTDAGQITRDIEQTKQRLSGIAEADTTDHAQRIRQTLVDHLQTCEERLANHAKAKDNAELVALEIERLETKIRTLAEMGVNRQDPDFIAGQVNAVAGGMLETEKTMNELQSLTGITHSDDDVPDMLSSQKQMHFIN